MAQFTVISKGHSIRINSVSRVEEFRYQSSESDTLKSMSADTIWDTGSSVSVISERLAAELHLEPSGVTKISGIENRPFEANTYLVNIEFPNGVLAKYTTVVESPMVLYDLLIGMDVISEGDFVLSHDSGNTVFSFRYPSEGEIKF